MSYSSVPVLMHHHVHPGEGFINCSPENFEDQLKWLSKNDYKSLTLAEFSEHLAGEDKGNKSVVITFDDGYLDNWVYAFPLLKKYGFKATIFIVTSWVGQGDTRSTSESAEHPKCLVHTECEKAIKDGKADQVILRWSEIEAMRKSGLVEFHSHTHTHTRWDLVKPEHKNEKMVWELTESRKVLKKRLGSASEHLCWPQGYFDKDYINIAKKAGFNYLYTTLDCGRNTYKTQPEGIRRFAVKNRDEKDLRKRIFLKHRMPFSPAYNAFKNFRHKLQGREGAKRLEELR